MSEMHRVYMSFFVRGSDHGDRWVVSFLERDCKTSLSRIREFHSDKKIREIAKRGKAFKDLADHQAFASAIVHGRGGVFLSLTDEQYRALRSR